MKRYLVFANQFNSPIGGMNDFINDFDSLQEAKDCALAEINIDWFHVYDTKHKEIVFKN